ncbi:cell division cycle-associated protein 3-like [Scleropages formosus]|uniref:Cell division cycle-associated protein 3-like n=1 Tax=Scleropages formosus TaxID=113540 RepID=A0A0P7U026_SCLFO|nr:cell division cycle-associated protein 3-like [Scleropages formosus]
MGSGESKISVSTPKAKPGTVGERVRRHGRLARLVDPRSPSVGIDRTPIQVGPSAQAPVEAEYECPVSTSDPRSPSPGIIRTPMKDVMRATVSSFARRLSMLFLNDGAERMNNLPPVTYSKIPNLRSDARGETDLSEPLLPLRPDPNSALDPISPPDVDAAHSGCLSKAEQVEVDMEVGVEACHFLEEELDDDLPLNVGLSSSLLTCHKGVVLSQALSDDAPLSISPPHNADTHGNFITEASPAIVPEPSEPSRSDRSASPVPVPSSSVKSTRAEAEPFAQPDAKPEEMPVKAIPDPSASQNKPLRNRCGSEQNGIRLPTFDSRSPSQAVFKPQWLGVGFGVTGVRARGVQGRGKGASSPLSVRGGQNAGNENKGQMVKQKPRERCGKALASDCRSPLQILKETNSPRDLGSQMKLKVSTPDRLWAAQADRRTLSLDKENQ